MALSDDITLNKFSSTVSRLARTNRFIVTISDYDSKNFEDLKFFITKAVIPSVDITGPEMYYFGTKIVLAGDPKFEPLTLSFLNGTYKSNDWKIRSYFEDWMKLITQYSSIDNEHGEGILNYREGSTIKVEQLDYSSSVIATYEFYNAIPLSITAIDLDMNTNDQTETFDVVFNYTYFKRL